MLLFGAAVGGACWGWFSASLDDTDATFFLAGMERFSLSESRPHPPGYPVYLLLGKLACLFGLEAREALQLVSCVSAGISAALLPRFFRALSFTWAKAWSLSLAVVCTPLFVLTSCKILTDGAGFAALLWLSILWLERPARTGFGFGVGVALTLGIRPHGVLTLLPALTLGPWRRRLVGVCCMLLLMVALVAYYNEGSFLQAMSTQATMRFKTPGVSLFSPGTGLPGALERLERFQWVFFRDVFGLGGAAKVAIYILFVIGCGVLWRLPSSSQHDSQQEGQDVVKRPARWLMGGAVFYLFFLFLFLPAHPRYFLPIVPLVIAAVTWGRLPLALPLALLMLPVTFERVSRLNRGLAPPELALEWVEAHDPKHELPILRGPLASYARVLEPQRVIFSGLGVQGLELPRVFFAEGGQVAPLLNDPGSFYHVIDRQLFRRDAELHDKWSTIEVVMVGRG